MRPDPECGPTLAELAGRLASGQTSSRQLVEDCLVRIADPEGEGARAFTLVDTAQALAAADAFDKLREHGASPSRFAGIPVSVKDLFDVAGQVTCAGSRVLAWEAAARCDATAVQRLRRAGFVLIGRTQMPEFALSALGLNPHFGTPLSPWDRATARAPGGSSSGAAVSVADGMAHAALGSDTGGSCRIPAAFCGVVGFKPTARSVPTDGVVPLAPSLDAVGPLARSVSCCASLYALLSATADTPLVPLDLRGLRLGVPRTLVLDGLDEAVAVAFDRVLVTLSERGAVIVDLKLAAFSDVPRMHARGSFAAAESLAWHRTWITRHRDRYDPRVLERIERGAQMTATDYIDLLAARQAFVEAVGTEAGTVDAMVMPTCAIVPPRIADLHDDAVFNRLNLMALRNAALVNLFDGCAISLPMHRRGEPPSGLMIANVAGQDRSLLKIANSVEAALIATLTACD